MTYLDHAATTPMLPAVKDAFVEALETYGNASSLHSAGRKARRAVEEARERIAEALDVRTSEVLFTSGGTESNNLAAKGIFWARRDSDSQKRIIVTSTVEHHAVLDAVKWLESHEGARIVWVPVDRDGFVSSAHFGEILEEHSDHVAVATVMMANNETGAVQPVDELAALARAHKIPFHTDAVQALGHLQLQFNELGVNSLALTGHKVGGPGGVGVLLLDRHTECVPLLHGGGHERKVRSGSVNVAGGVALAIAVEEAVRNQAEHVKRLNELRHELVARVREAVPDSVLNGLIDGPQKRSNDAQSTSASPNQQLPGVAHFSFPGCEGDSLLMLLDEAGIQCSTGAACASGVPEPSHVLLAMGVDQTLARSSLRFSLGHSSKQQDIDALVAALPAAVERARAAGLGR